MRRVGVGANKPEKENTSAAKMKKEIKELKAENEQLKTDVELLMSENTELKAENEQLKADVEQKKDK